MNEQTFEIFKAFDEIKLTAEAKDKIYENIVKNKKLCQKRKKQKAFLPYLKYASFLIAVFFLCFSVKSFYDINRKTSEIYIGKENGSSYDKILENKSDNEEIIVYRNDIKNEDSVKTSEKTKEEKAPLLKNADETEKNTKNIKKDKSQTNTETLTNEKFDNAVSEKEQENTTYNKTLQTEDVFSDFQDSDEVLATPKQACESGETRDKISSGGGSGGGSSAAAKQHSSGLDELFENEVFGTYFPTEFINGYSFVDKKIEENYAVAYYKSNFHRITVTVNLLTENSSYGKIKAEREDENGNYFDVPVKNALITYFVSDKQLKKEEVYLMLHSAQCFKK